jgi:hypothetical protein
MSRMDMPYVPKPNIAMAAPLALTVRRSDPVHCWLVWRKADEARDYLYRGIEETGIPDTACHFSRETFGLHFAGPGSIVKVQASP